MNKIAVSACLVGKNTRYDGKNSFNQAVMDYIKNKEIIYICPEVVGLLGLIRPKSEILENKVINVNGVDVTSNYEKGALLTINKLLKENVTTIIVKSKSPSCGYKKIYDGTFSKTLIDGNGIFVRLAMKYNFNIYTELDIEYKIKDLK